MCFLWTKSLRNQVKSSWQIHMTHRETVNVLEMTVHIDTDSVEVVHLRAGLYGPIKRDKNNIILAYIYIAFSPYLYMSPPIVLHVKSWISKSYSHCRKGFNYAENVGKPKNVQELENFLKNSRQLNCSGPTRDSWITITKQKDSRETSRKRHTVLRFKGM